MASFYRKKIEWYFFGMSYGMYKTKKPRMGLIHWWSGGEGGIRTHGDVATTPDFESGTFDHSATSPAFNIAAGHCRKF
jgi:hypothetical protein